MEKKCCYCKSIKDISEFYLDKQNSNGRKPRCKECEKLYINKERRKKYEKEYWDKNRERKRKIVLKSLHKNWDHHEAIQKAYRQTERFKELHSKDGATRRARLKNAKSGEINYIELYNRDSFCFYCRKDIEFKDVHFDHYVPLSKGGNNTEDNIRVSCQKCNLTKGAKMPHEMEVCYPLV